MANEQTVDKIDNIKSKDPSFTEMNNNESNITTQHLQTIINNNSSSNINDEDNKKTINETSLTKSNTNIINDQVVTLPCDSTSETSNDQNVSVSPISATNHQHHKKSSIKTNRKSHKHDIQDHSLNESDDENNRQRSLSSSSSSSSASSSTSSDNQISNIPYETLHNDDDDDDDDRSEHTNATTNQISP